MRSGIDISMYFSKPFAIIWMTLLDPDRRGRGVLQKVKLGNKYGVQCKEACK